MLSNRLNRSRVLTLSFLATIAALGFVVQAFFLAPAAVAQAPTRHIIGARHVPTALQAIQARNLRVIDVIPLIDAIVVEGPAQAAKGLAHAPFVRYVEPDPLDAVWTQEDTLAYGVFNIEAEVVWGGATNAISVIPGHGGAGVKVAVIDTGIDCTHPDLSPNCVWAANFVKGSKKTDEFGHGTHVAGIIAARDNGFGVIGVAPEATLYAVKVLDANGSGSWSAVASGIVWAVQNGMHVINMSLGGTSSSQAVADAVTAAWNAGILIVSAAGNSGCCDTVLYPAKYPETMAVAAVDQNDQRATFSSTGPELDVAAPGVAILSTVPTGSCKLCDPSGYRTLSGTSMATPHVAGTGALLISRGFTAAQAWAQMRATAKDLGSAGFDGLTGCGRVDAYLAVSTVPGVLCTTPSDTTPPVVAFASPPDGAVLSGNIMTVEVDATDASSLAAIELYLVWTSGGWTYSQLLATSDRSPLVFKWHISGLSSGTYRLKARAIAVVGTATTTTITVTKP